MNTAGTTVVAASALLLAGAAAAPAAQPPAAAALASAVAPVETVRIFFIQDVLAFQTEATDTLAQDFAHYMSRNLKPAPHFLLQRTSLWSRLPPGPVTFDIMFPYTEPQGLVACLEHDLLPFAAVASRDQSPFQQSVVIARAGQIRCPADLHGKRLCVGGRRPGFDFFVLKERLRTVLATNTLATITLIHIFTNRALMAEMRRDLIHYVLTDKADFTVVRRYELALFAQYYPRCAERLEVISWLDLPPVSLDTWAAVPRARYADLQKYRDELCRMHLDPEGEQYLMLVGLQRVVPIDPAPFFALTNYLHLVESLDFFVWP